jgi:hypothetical protein
LNRRLPLAAPAWLSIKPKQADLFKKDFFPFGFRATAAMPTASLMHREEMAPSGFWFRIFLRVRRRA